MSGRLIFVRHAQSEGNATRSFTLDSSSPITMLGRQQARQVAARIEQRFDPVRLISSPFLRAQQTAAIIRQRIHLPIETVPELREQSLGELRGQPYEVLRELDGFGSVPRWEWRPPGGETLVEVQARAVPPIRRIAAAHADDDVILVSHGGTLFSLWAHAAQNWHAARSISNSALLVLPHDGRQFGEPELEEGPEADTRDPDTPGR